MDYSINNINNNIPYNIMKKEQGLKLLECQKQLNNNQLPKQLIDECYGFLPDVIPDTFLRVKVQAIQRYVMFNMDIISTALKQEDMKTTVVVEQSPRGTKKTKTVTRPAKTRNKKVTKPVVKK